MVRVSLAAVANRLTSASMPPSLALLVACGAPTQPLPDPPVILAYDAEAIAEGNRGRLCDEEAIAARVEAILQQMTLEQKAAQMHGVSLLPNQDLYDAGGIPELGVPTLKMVDGPRGVRAGNATAFPVGIARGATWDPALEKRVGEAIALEARAKGANVILAPTINLLRHPGWGRSQETYSEDPMHMGALAVGFTSGAQNHLIASAKHFAVNSIEDTRFEVDVTIDPRTLRELYLPHFRRVVGEAAVGSVMSAYNQVNGAYCSENAPLLRDILRGEWGFRGFVESDWVLGVHSTTAAALAGLDIEMPASFHFGDPLVDAVNDGDLPASTLDEAVGRILRTSLCFGLDTMSDELVDPTLVEGPEHIALAREVALASAVLLKNEAAALPIVDDAGEPLPSIAMIGALAEIANLGDLGSSAVTPSAATTPLDGLEAAAQARGATVVAIPRDVLSEEDRAAIAGADAAVVVVGLTWEDEGEAIPMQEGGGDRDDLRLRPEQEALILEVAAIHPRTIVLLEGGGAILVRPWIDEVEAALLAWYPGVEGGTAVAELLLGDASPSGKLPLTIPRSPDQLPPFDHESLAVTYDAAHGYRRLDSNSDEPEFPFGHGLSYTTFSLDALTIETPQASIDADASLKVTVDLENTGDRAGAEVVQLYVGAPGEAVPRPLRELRAFGKVALDPGERIRLEMSLRTDDLAYYDALGSAWRVEPGRYRIEVGTSSRDLPLSGEIELTSP